MLQYMIKLLEDGIQIDEVLGEAIATYFGLTPPTIKKYVRVASLTFEIRSAELN